MQDGRQVIVFEYAISSTDHDIYYNVLNTNGTLQTAATSPAGVQLNTSYQGFPHVAGGANTALITYSNNTGETNTNDLHVSARLFTSATNSLGGEITVADGAAGQSLAAADVAAIGPNRYVILYESVFDVFAKIYDAGTGILGPEITVNIPDHADFVFSSGAKVAATPNGGFVVAWDEINGPGNIDEDIHARNFDPNGNAIGAPIKVNTFTEFRQEALSLAVSGANVLIAWQDEVARATDTTPDGIRAQMFSIAAPHDFNLDLFSDLMFQDGNGQTVLWEMSGAGQKANLGVGTINPDYAIQDLADFDGDGRADILFRHTSGATLLWTMNGAVNTSQSSIGTINPNYIIQGAADFSGDGKSDILFRGQAAGDTVLWTMDGNVNTGQFSIGTLNPNYKIQALADFNGDGKADILFRGAAAGDTILWTMNGAVNTGQFSVGNINLAYHVAGTGDFNGDGSADILFHGDNGDYILWTMNGGVNTGQFSIGPINPAYQAADIEDFNGDGKADILFRSSNDAVIWEMNGGTNIGQIPLGTISNAFQVVQHHYDIV
jgi:hypothetical protein